jgi:HK97 gp10 family phage protein
VADGLSFATKVVFNRFPKVKADMVANAEAFTAKAAMDMEAGMKSRIVAQGAVDTGFLLNSVQAKKVGPAFWRVTVGADYGIYVDQGTRHMNARPFFFVTAAEVGATFMRAMRSITT